MFAIIIVLIEFQLVLVILQIQINRLTHFRFLLFFIEKEKIKKNLLKKHYYRILNMRVA